MSIEFTDVCFITNDVIKMRAFYERVFDCTGEGDEIHSFIHAPGLGIAIYNKQKSMGENPEMDYTSPGNDCRYIGFNCDDADDEYRRIATWGVGNPSIPVTWPWGAKSFNLRDPDGNLIVIRSWPRED